MYNTSYGKERLGKLQGVVAAERVGQRAVEPSGRPWGLEQIAGRLVEISGVGATAALTVAFGLVLEAQRRGEPVAWIALEERGFYPPDAAEGGVDLGALVVVRVANAKAVGRAADQLVRSGAFGLIVLDLGAGVDGSTGLTTGLPTPLQTRLVGLAQKHQTALLCLTEKGGELPSLGSVVTLRVHAQRERVCDDRFSCGLAVLKDKRRGLTWTHAEICRGAAGLR